MEWLLQLLLLLVLQRWAAMLARPGANQRGLLLWAVAQHAGREDLGLVGQRYKRDDECELQMWGAAGEVQWWCWRRRLCGICKCCRAGCAPCTAWLLPGALPAAWD
jgi:hypothetical protein